MSADGGQIEMNYRVTERADLQELERWFDEDLALGTRAITESDFYAARKRHAQIRAGRPLSGTSLVDIATRNPDFLKARNIFVWVWKHTDRSKWADTKLAREQESRHDGEIDCYEDVEGLRYTPGSYILDFNIGSSSITFEPWQVLLDKPFVTEKVKGRTKNILLCRYAKSIAGIKLGPRKHWIDAAKRAAVSSRDEWTSVGICFYVSSTMRFSSFSIEPPPPASAPSA